MSVFYNEILAKIINMAPFNLKCLERKGQAIGTSRCHKIVLKPLMFAGYRLIEPVKRYPDYNINHVDCEFGLLKAIYLSLHTTISSWFSISM